jgi:hypothetical protein
MSNAVVSIISKETRISIIINMVLSAGFFFLAFGLSPKVLTTASPDQLALDFIPQSLAIGFFAALVPSLIMSGKRRKGQVEGVDSNAVPFKTNLLRAVGFALATGLAGLLLMFALPMVAATMGYFSALAMKVIYGGVLAFLVTPRALRLALATKKIQ